MGAALYSTRIAGYDSVIRTGGYISTATNIALDSDYLYNTRGDAFAQVFHCVESGTLTDIWIAVVSFNGTWGSTDGVINWQIREGWGAASNYPGSTLTASGTKTLAGTESNTWVKISGLSVSLTAGKCYFICIGDADGGGTNYVTLCRDVRHLSLIGPGNFGLTTTDGWATVRSSTIYPICMAWKVGSTIYSGSPWRNTTTALSSNTVARGNVFIPAQRMVAIGVTYSSQPTFLYGTNPWTFKIFKGAELPGGTPLKSFTFTTQVSAGQTPTPLTYFFPPADQVVLQAGVTYRFVVVPSTNSATPTNNANWGGMDADIRAVQNVNLGTLYATIESGGVWSDNTDETNQLSLVIGLGGLPTVVG